MSDGIPFELQRQVMVERQLRRRGIRDERALDAMLHVPRHEFVGAGNQSTAYEDQPMGIGEGQTISQPYMVAAMTEAAQVKPGDKVLEIGTGSGYQAAVLAEMGARVVTVERNESLAAAARERLDQLGYGAVEIRVDDGSQGYAPGAPYDAVIVTAGAPHVPPALIEHLANGGRLVIPVGALRQQILRLIVKHGGELAAYDLDACQFVPLVGKQAWPEIAGNQAGPER